MNAEAHKGADGRNELATSRLPRRHSNIVYVTATNTEVCAIAQYHQGFGEFKRSHNSALMHAKDVRRSGHVHRHVVRGLLVRLPHARAAALPHDAVLRRPLPPPRSGTAFAMPAEDGCLRSEHYLSLRLSGPQILHIKKASGPFLKSLYNGGG